MNQDALKLALEFLEDNQDLIEVYERPEYLSMYKAAINKCKEALAQPEQELVAAALFREALAFGLAYGPEIPVHQWDEMREEKVAQLVARLATPPAAQPEQEPLAYVNVEKRRLEFAEPMVWHTPTVVNLERIPLYTQQRTWVGLTKEQLATTDWSSDFRAGALWAEAKLRDKNWAG